MKQSRYKQIIGVLILILVSAPLLFSFQNCSKINSNSNIGAPTEASSGNVRAFSKKTSVIRDVANSNRAQQMDSSTPNCTAANLAGWKCLNTVVINADGDAYKVLIKWSRPNVESKATVLVGVGGAGVGESRDDPPSKLMMDKLADIDHIRVIAIEFMDPPSSSTNWGGFFVHNGAYKSAGSAFAETIKFIVDQQIVRGSYMNYLGGSNASTVAAYAMSNFGTDQYFDRVVFQMGPFIPNLKTACDPHSPSSIFINSPGQQSSVFSLINNWRYGDANHSICSDQSDDRISIIGNKTFFPNTHVHVIMGELEERLGFGPWILSSNLEWFNAISGKSKSRIIRPGIGHNNSYKDMRRYLKLDPAENPIEDPAFVDKEGEFCADSKIIKFNCRAEAQITPPTLDPNVAWVDQGNGCFQLKTSVSCGAQAPAPTTGSPFVIGGSVSGQPPTATQPVVNLVCTPRSGQFTDSYNRVIAYSCNCPAAPAGAGWVKQSDGCFHRLVSEAPDVCSYSYGQFVNESKQLIDYACGCNQAPSGSGWVSVGNNCYHRVH